MSKRINRTLLLLIVIAVMVLAVPLSAYAAFTEQTTFFDGTLIFSFETSNNNAETPFKVVTADSAVQGYTRNPTKYYTSTTATATIRMINNCGKNATLYFTYAFDEEGNGSVSITSTGTVSDTTGSLTDYSGDCSVMLANGGYVDIKFTSSGQAKAYDNYMNITAISLVPAADAAEVTVEYNESLGSVTANGTAIGSGDSAETSDGSVTLVATPASGCEFVGWTDTSNTILATDATYAMAPSADTAVKAVFGSASSEAIFRVDQTLYDLSGAITAAGNTETIILAASGTLSEGNYTIPSGVTLLVPYDDTNTLITNNMGDYVNTSHDNPPAKTLYRQLTMPSGTSITVNGAISVGSQALNQMIGQVGPYGCIVMDEGSNITVKSGGSLYAYGYIFYGEGTGGTVTVENGGAVYECLTTPDYDYAGAVTNAYDAKAFPLRSYTARNVEVPATYYCGAKIYTFFCTYSGTFNVTYGDYIQFIGTSDSNPFQMTSESTLVKSYADGRQQITINGDTSMNSISLEIQTTIGKTTLTSSQTSGFPIPSEYDITIASGTVTLNDNIIFTEGSTIEIAKGATINTNGKNVYVLDADDDPGSVDKCDAYSRDTADIHGTYYTHVNKDAVINVNGTAIVSGGFYTSAGGACITSSEGTGEIQITSASADSTINIKTVNFESGLNTITFSCTFSAAKLQNADGTYLTSAKDTYTYSDNAWHCTYHYDATGDSDHICDACGEAKASNCTDKTDDGNHTCDECGAADITSCSAADAVTENAVAATCTADGSYDTVTYCSECGKELSRVTTTEPAPGHSYGDTAYTWSDDGKSCTATRACTRTDCTHSESATAAVSSKVTTAATCTTKGTTTYTAAFNVDWATEQTTTRQDVDMIEHSYTTEASASVKAAATCHSVAVYYAQCDNCDAVSETVTVDGTEYDANNHDGDTENVAEVPATCQAAGTTAGVKCLGCTQITSGCTEIEKLTCADTDNDHYCNNGCNEKLSDCSFTEKGELKTVATCVTKAVYEAKCNICGAVSETDTIEGEVDSSAHDLKTVAAQTASCTQIGWAEYEYCQREGCEYSTYAEIPMTDHDYSEEYLSDANGHWHKCVNCTATTDAVAHTEETVPGYAATCTATGLTDGIKCSVCDYVIKAQEVVPVTGHSYNSVVTAPTCTTGGYTTYTCSVCGDTYTGDKVTANGHTEATREENRSEATCAKDGSYDLVTYCTVCTEVLKTEKQTIPATGNHSYGEVTYTGDGKTEYKAERKCSCGDTQTAIASIASTVTKEATCTAVGETTYTATFTEDWATGTTTTEEIAKLAHSYGTEWKSDDTNHWHECTCGAKSDEAEHDWGDGVVTKEATSTEVGEKTYTCDTCDATKTEEIPVKESVIKLYQRSLMLEELVCVRYQFTVDSEYTEDYIKENGGLLVWLEDDISAGKEYVIGTETYQVSLSKNGSRYVADAKGVAAKKMGDTMYARGYIKNTEGEYEYTEIIDFNPVEYAKLVLARTEDVYTKLHPLLVAMVNYGAAAQQNFNYKTDNLMNSWLTQEQQALVEFNSNYIEALDTDVSKYKQTADIAWNSLTHPLVLEDNVWIRFKFKLDTEVMNNAAEMKLAYWSESQYNAVDELTLDNASGTSELTVNGSYYTGDIKGIAAKQMGNTYYACVYVKNNDGTEQYSSLDVFSIHYYASAIINGSYGANLTDLCKWIVAYSYQAKAYFPNA